MIHHIFLLKRSKLSIHLPQKTNPKKLDLSKDPERLNPQQLLQSVQFLKKKTGGHFPLSIHRYQKIKGALQTKKMCFTAIWIQSPFVFPWETSINLVFLGVYTLVPSHGRTGGRAVWQPGVAWSWCIDETTDVYSKMQGVSRKPTTNPWYKVLENKRAACRRRRCSKGHCAEVFAAISRWSHKPWHLMVKITQSR